VDDIPGMLSTADEGVDDIPGILSNISTALLMSMMRVRMTYLVCYLLLISRAF
jgi:hypothetical protein